MLRLKNYRAISILPLLLSWAGGGLPCAFAAGAEPSGVPSPETVLFPYDDVSIPLSKGLLLTLLPGSKWAGDHGTGFDPKHPNKPVLLPGNPGDPDHPKLYYYGTVLKVDGEYRMWYTGWDKDSKRLVCYATSPDGIAWNKPKLGLVQYNGGTANNLVSIDGGASIACASCWVLYEPEDPNAEHRFKMVREVGPRDIMAAFSPDGLHWTSFSGNPIIHESGIEPSGLVKINGCYYLNGQGGPIPNRIPEARKRVMVTFISYDFEHWTTAAHLDFRRDNVPPRLPSDFELHRGEQIHVGASIWNRGNVLLGFYGQYHNETNDRRDCTIDLGLLVTNDALHYREPIPDFKIVPSYEETDQADPRLLQGQGFENIGDRTLFWYSIWPVPHANLLAENPTGVRVATWVRDRLGYFSPVGKTNDIFGATVMGIAAPHCVSAPLHPQNPSVRVYVNADGLSELSTLVVELLDERLEPVPGFSGADCIPVAQSGLRQLVTWKGGDLARLNGRAVRVRISWIGARPEAARLYAAYVQ